jgi:hypothetical protein
MNHKIEPGGVSGRMRPFRAAPLAPLTSIEEGFRVSGMKSAYLYGFESCAWTHVPEYALVAADKFR